MKIIKINKGKNSNFLFLKIRKVNEVDEIYIGLKYGKNEDNIKEEDIKNTWKKIIQKAYTLQIKTDVMSINK